MYGMMAQQQQQKQQQQQQQQSSEGKYSTIYVSKGSASQMIGEILHSPSDTVEKLREAICIECAQQPGFVLKISSETIPPGKMGFELVSRFLNPDFPVVVVNPE